MSIRHRRVEIALFIGAFIPGLTLAERFPLASVVVLVSAGLAFLLAFILGEQDRRELSGYAVLAATLMPPMLSEIALEQAEAPEALMIAHAILQLLLLAAVFARVWWIPSGPLPLRAQAPMTLPWILLMALGLNAFIDYMAGEVIAGRVEHGFGFALLLGFGPLLFGYFIVAPAKLVDREEIGWQRWALRYALAVASALLSALVFSLLS